MATPNKSADLDKQRKSRIMGLLMKMYTPSYEVLLLKEKQVKLECDQAVSIQIPII